MDKFFGSIDLNIEDMIDYGIDYRMKIGYYKIIDKNQLINKKYGIKVIKKEYKNNKTKTEEKTINNLSDNEEKINRLLEIFKRNSVTPICVEEIICDFSKDLLV